MYDAVILHDGINILYKGEDVNLKMVPYRNYNLSPFQGKLYIHFAVFPHGLFWKNAFSG